MALIASCSKTVLTHEIGNPEPLIGFSPHKGTVNSVIWNHNNQVIASCGSDGKIVLSHSSKATNLLSLPFQDAKIYPVINSICFSSQSQYLVSGCNEGKVRIYDLKQKSLLNTIQPHFGAISSVDWNHDDTVVASCSQVGDIVLNHALSGTQIANFSSQTSNGFKMAQYSPLNVNLIASAGLDGSVNVWDITSRTAIANFTMAHKMRTSAVAFSMCNQVLLCSASIDQKINFYDINQKQIVQSLTTDAPLTALSFNSDGHTIVVGTMYGGVSVYDLRGGGNSVNTLNGHDKKNPVNFVDFHHNPDRTQNERINTSTSISSNSGFGTNVHGSYDRESNFQQQPADFENMMKIRQGLLSQNVMNDISNKSRGSQILEKVPPKPNSSSGGSLTQSNSNQQLLGPNQSNNTPVSTINPNKIIEKPPTMTSFAYRQNTPDPEEEISQRPFIEEKQQTIKETNLPKFGINQQDYDTTGQTAEKKDLFKNSSQSVLNKIDTLKNGDKNEIQSFDLRNVEIDQNEFHNKKPKSIYEEEDEKPQQILKAEQILQMNGINISSNGSYSLSGTNNNNSSIEKEFTDNQRQYIQNIIEESQSETREIITDQMQNLQLEILRQFQIQQSETQALLQKMIFKNHALEEKVKLLTIENQNLKQISY